MTKKRGLGRGLAALMGEAGMGEAGMGEAGMGEAGSDARIDETPAKTPAHVPAETPAQTHNAPSAGSVPQTPQFVGIDQLVAGRYQPRRHFDTATLQALTTSLKKNGVLQPLIVRPQGDKYEIIAGERRWRAAQLAQLHSVPVLIRPLSDAQALEVGLIENIQRSDLNPMEEAEGYLRLANEFAYTQAAIAEMVGKSRSHIANMLRLNDAPPQIRDYLISGALTSGHARALLGHKDGETLARQVVAQGLSVRATEVLAARGKSTSRHARQAQAGQATKDSNILALEKQLSDALGVAVVIQPTSNEAGAVRIAYKSLEQFDALARLLLQARLASESFNA